MQYNFRLDLHSLIYRRVIARFFKTHNKALRKAAVSPFMWAFACVPALLSILFMGSTITYIAGLLFTTLAYAHFYARLSQFSWKPARLCFWGRPSCQD